MATLRLESGQTIEIPDGIDEKQAHKYTEQAMALAKQGTPTEGRSWWKSVRDGALDGLVGAIPIMPNRKGEGNALGGYLQVNNLHQPYQDHIATEVPAKAGAPPISFGGGIDWGKVNSGEGMDMRDPSDEVKAAFHSFKEDPARAIGGMLPFGVSGVLEKLGLPNPARALGWAVDKTVNNPVTRRAGAMSKEMFKNPEVEKTVQRNIPYLKDALKVKDVLKSSWDATKPDANARMTPEYKARLDAQAQKGQPPTDPYSKPPSQDPGSPDILKALFADDSPPGPRSQQGVGAQGGELETKYAPVQADTEPPFPRQPYNDPYSNPPSPQAAGSRPPGGSAVDPRFNAVTGGQGPSARLMGVGAGPEVDAGLPRTSYVDPKGPAPNLDPYGSPTARDPWAQGFRAAPPDVPNVASRMPLPGSMEYNNMVSHKLNLAPSTEVANVPNGTGAAKVETPPPAKPAYSKQVQADFDKYQAASQRKDLLAETHARTKLKLSSTQFQQILDDDSLFKGWVKQLNEHNGTNFKPSPEFRERMRSTVLPKLK